MEDEGGKVVKDEVVAMEIDERKNEAHMIAKSQPVGNTEAVRSHRSTAHSRPHGKCTWKSQAISSSTLIFLNLPTNRTQFKTSIGYDKDSSLMASNRGQGGIQQLLAAEQEAQRIVNAAKNEKSARLKQAKEEAEKEIAEYRAQLEQEFQRKVSESTGDSGANVQRLEQETEEKIHHLKYEAARISDDVVAMLLKHVTSVKN
ncbi:hypothetical protein VNO78_20858 [Psophocarpus tetragonolobus]|uniref:V-type proton ATPase subunit G n=1 Tax=Psophocarpus tetragonolobus TaxID=3891 RepID=A0AAN9SA58_PSOTE